MNQLVCTFVKSHQIGYTLEDIENTFSLTRNVFLSRIICDSDEYILSYQIARNTDQSEFLSNTIAVHRKRETNTLYTLNALNALIVRCNNGVLDKTFEVNWYPYRDMLVLKKNDVLETHSLEFIHMYTL